MKKTFPIHPAALLLPEVTGDARSEMKASLERGQLEPIYLHKDKVLDGRTRQELLTELGITPRYEKANLRGRTPERFVVDMNLERRMVTPSQKGWLALQLLPELKGLEKKHGKPTDGKATGGKAKRAAKIVGTSTRTVERAIAIAKAAPELGPKIAAGEVTLKQAEKKLRNAEQVKQVAAYVPPEGKFNVVTVDFSWEYDDKLDGSDAVRGGCPYPPMKIGEILTFIRKELAKCCDETCVLGSWITGPMSLDLRVGPLVQFEIQKLGFKPLHERIWKKTRATGGQFVGLGRPIRWDVEKLQIFVRGNVVFNELGEAHGRPIQQSVFEANVGDHSEKPQRAYDDLEQLVPYTKRLEMFARKARPGWTGSGAELSQPPKLAPPSMDDVRDAVSHARRVVLQLAKPSASGESASAQSAPVVQSESPPVATSGASFSSGAGSGVPGLLTDPAQGIVNGLPVLIGESDRSESKKRGKAAEALSIEQLRDRVAKTLKEKGRADEELKQLGAKVVANAIEDRIVAESLAAQINAPPTEEQKRRAAQMLRDGSMTIENKPRSPGQPGDTVAGGASDGGRPGVPDPAQESAELFTEEYQCTDCGEVFVALEILSKHSKRCTGTGPVTKPSRPVFHEPPPSGAQAVGYVPPLVPGSTTAVEDDGIDF